MILKRVVLDYVIQRGHVAYHEDSDEYWYRYDRDSEGRVTYCEDSSKFWSRHEYDSEGNETYYEVLRNYWVFQRSC